MKILYLLFAVFFLVLQSTPGFANVNHQNTTTKSATTTASPIKTPVTILQCIRVGGFCFGICLPPFRPMGTCGFGVPCCTFSYPLA
ncbi:beta-defensin 5-like [Mauremys reevesii]|uniref:beta-defensin 5-like n=1 Tax=Mauremys reevesii TaxID=260615 RepID=UPI00193F33BE|nr:beta-defensin 5-like [Mauremys reevesii]